MLLQVFIMVAFWKQKRKQTHKRKNNHNNKNPVKVCKKILGVYLLKIRFWASIIINRLFIQIYSRVF